MFSKFISSISNLFTFKCINCENSLSIVKYTVLPCNHKICYECLVDGYKKNNECKRCCQTYVVKIKRIPVYSLFATPFTPTCIVETVDEYYVEDTKQRHVFCNAYESLQ